MKTFLNVFQIKKNVYLQSQIKYNPVRKTGG